MIVIALHVVACLMLCDLLTGIGHWVEDTYGHLGMADAIRRFIVLDNIQHHRRPATILRGSWWECNRVLLIPCTAIALLCAATGITAWQVYFVLAVSSQSNHIHRWAHTAAIPDWVAVLQSFGLLQSRKHHAVHHQSPYAVRFCTVTNYLNPVLDRIGFWRVLERIVQSAFGVPVRRATAAREGY